MNNLTKINQDPDKRHEQSHQNKPGPSWIKGMNNLTKINQDPVG